MDRSLIKNPSDTAIVQVSCGYYFFLMLTEGEHKEEKTTNI